MSGRIIWRPKRGQDGEVFIARFIDIARASIGAHRERQATIEAMLEAMPADARAIVKAEIEADPVERTQAEIAKLLDRADTIEQGLRESSEPAPIAPLLHEVRAAMTGLLSLVVVIALPGIADAARRDRAITKIAAGDAQWRFSDPDWVIAEIDDGGAAA